MKYLKEHWFGITVTLFMAYYLLVFVLVVTTSNKDQDNFGFKICSSIQTEKILNCEKENKTLCVLNTIISGNACYIYAFNHRIINIISGKKSSSYNDYNSENKSQYDYDAEIKKLLEENPNLLSSMQEIQLENKKLMEKINQQQKGKNHE